MNTHINYLAENLIQLIEYVIPDAAIPMLASVMVLACIMVLARVMVLASVNL